nr:unnamed protein product [Digitaria exilis]
MVAGRLSGGHRADVDRPYDDEARSPGGRALTRQADQWMGRPREGSMSSAVAVAAGRDSTTSQLLSSAYIVPSSPRASVLDSPNVGVVPSRGTDG